jgi:hypothetical protein
MAHSTICARRSSMRGDERMTTPSICSRAARSKASLKSSGPRIGSECSVTPAACAAICVARNWASPMAESHNAPGFESVGTTSLRSSICLPPSSGRSRNSPVKLPPGRAKLLTHPLATGSFSKSIPTIGIVVVAFIAATNAYCEAARMTSHLRSTSSFARFGSRSSVVSKIRVSITAF